MWIENKFLLFGNEVFCYKLTKSISICSAKLRECSTHTLNPST